GSRDAEMAKLIQTYLPKASTRDGGDLIAKTETSPMAALARVLLPKTGAPTPDQKPEREELASAPDNVKPLQEEIPFKMAAKPARLETAAAPVVAAAYAEPEAPVDPVSTASLPSGWAVQVASSPSKGEAKGILDKVSKQAP